MPKHKEALIRYRIIDRCLCNRKEVTIDDLIEACADKDIIVSERTIREDIKNMKYDLSLGFDAPIENIRPQKYRYSDFNYSINKLPLSDEELESLAFASKLLEQFSDMAPFDQIPGAIQKIFNHLKIRHSLNEQEYSEMIDFEKAAETKGLNFIEPLLKAIQKKQVVEITYQHFGDTKKNKRIVHPYLLKEYLNRWYVLGFNEDVNDLRIYGLDRIVKITVEYGKNYRPSLTRPKDYFKNVIGVTKFDGTKPEKIILKFSNLQANYILSQPLHESQKIIEKTAHHTIISIEVHSSPELQIILLGWHSEVEVLAPESLRNKVRDLIKGAGENYN